MYYFLYYICRMNEDFILRWKSQVRKGILSLVVLKIISKGEYYGYELIEEIKRLTDMEIAEGTLYPLLIRLKEDGLVTSRWVEQESGIPRKYYTLTSEGESRIGEMNSFLDEFYLSVKNINRS